MGIKAPGIGRLPQDVWMTADIENFTSLQTIPIILAHPQFYPFSRFYPEGYGNPSFCIVLLGSIDSIREILKQRISDRISLVDRDQLAI